MGEYVIWIIGLGDGRPCFSTFFCYFPIEGSFILENGAGR